MASGVYGISVPTNIDASMVDIFYSYHKTRNSDSAKNAVFMKLPCRRNGWERVWWSSPFEINIMSVSWLPKSRIGFILCLIPIMSLKVMRELWSWEPLKMWMIWNRTVKKKRGLYRAFSVFSR